MAENENNSENYEDGDLGTVTLTLDDDTEVECAILAIYPVDDKQYIALLPVDENGDAADDADVLIYRFYDNGDDGDPDLENIEADEEYQAAADAFDQLLDEDSDEDECECEDEELNEDENE